MRTTQPGNAQPGNTEPEISVPALEVLQLHIDIYRNLPEVCSPTTIGCEHRGLRASKGCEELARQGLITAERIDKKPKVRTHLAGTEKEVIDLAAESLGTTDFGDYVRVEKRPSGWRAEYEESIALPGYRARLTDKGTGVAAALFKQGIIKKNDW